MTYSEVKKLVERVTGIEDIGTERRTRLVADARFVYYQLCKKYVHPSQLVNETTYLRLVGDHVNRDRTSVIHGLNEFQFLSRDKTWWGGWLYKLCVNIARGEARRKLNGTWKPPVITKEYCKAQSFNYIK